MVAAVATPRTNQIDAAETPHAGLVLDVAKLTPERAVTQLIARAVELGASDLFFSPNEQHVAVQVRALGVLRLLSILPAELGKRCVAHVKTAAEMDTTERRRPTDGRWIVELNDDTTTVDVRISAIPTLWGEDLALRLLVRDNRLFGIENLGLAPHQLADYRAMLDSPGGLVLITGPTGSGKTATLYASLAYLAAGNRKINTIEDPIEYAVEGLRLSQVNPATGLTFAELLRGVLRQAPDVIMVGEVRDPQTAETAVHAANSGTLVFATVHAPAAPAAVQSMLAYGVNPHFLASSLRGVVSQRLVRTFCPACRCDTDLTDAPHTFDEVRNLLAHNEGRTLGAAAGCGACGNTGYAGRTGVFEVMSVSASIRQLVADARPARELRAKAVAERMITFRQAALLKVALGETSTEEILRAIPPEHMLLED